MKTIISKVKNTLDGINGRIDIAEEIISELIDTQCKISKMTCREKKELKRESISYGKPLSSLTYL